MSDLLDLLGAVGIGALAGLVVTAVLLHRSAAARARDRFEAWRADEHAGIRRSTLASARGGIKAEVSRGLGHAVGALPFEAADVRFLGDPVTFVVFDGHTEVKDRSSYSLRGISFVTVGDAFTDPDGTGLLIAECVAGGRVEWLTVRLP